MAFIAVSGEPGCRPEEVARMAALRLQCKLVTRADLEKLVANQFGDVNQIPDRAWPAAAVSVLAGLGLEHHLVVCCHDAERLVGDLPAAFRFHLVAPESIRLRNIASDNGLSRAQAKKRVHVLASAQTITRKRRFGQKNSPITSFDMVVNAQAMAEAAMVDLLETAVRSRALLETGPLSLEAAAKVQFQAGLQLARHGLAQYILTAPDRTPVERKAFGHPSEQVFANLLDFYRIAWDYEPRSFPLQWDKDGKVSEAFTPDFYLPEFDLYVELTTMKQANVTRKNRKIRLLRAIYPHVNIQIFYQKDVQDLVLKYRAPERVDSITATPRPTS
jgi:cytidylate kinase